MDLEFQRHCHARLTGNQFAVFAVLHEIGPCITTQPEIAAIMSAGSKRINFHMVALRKLNFIRYEALGKEGIDLYWVKTSQTEKPPPWRHKDTQHYRYHLKHQSAGDVWLRPGNVAEFARTHGLRAESVRNVIRGQWKNYKGWSLAED